MLTEVETDSRSSPLSAREVRERGLEEKHAREKSAQRNLERLADFIMDAIDEFWGQTSGDHSVDLTLSSPETSSKIRLRVDDSGRVFDVTNESRF